MLISIVKTQTVRAKSRIYRLLILCVLFGLNHCVYNAPVDDRQELINLLPAASSEREHFSYDPSSPLLIPYLTGLYKHRYSGNIVETSGNVSITFPLIPMRPGAIGLSTSLKDSSATESTIRLRCNDHTIGYMTVSGQKNHQTFKLRESVWDAQVNLVEIDLVKGKSSVVLENIWLSKSKTLNPEKLETGDIFCGYAAYPREDVWEEVIFLGPQVDVSFPVRLPEEQAFFNSEIFPSRSSDVKIQFQLITAEALRRSQPLNTEIFFKKADAWLPIHWNVSEKAGKHAILRLKNSGHTGVMLRNAMITRHDDAEWDSK